MISLGSEGQSISELFTHQAKLADVARLPGMSAIRLLWLCAHASRGLCPTPWNGELFRRNNNK